MEFDSHISGLVLAGVALVNAVSPGLRGGREVAVPTGPALADAVAEALGHASFRPVERLGEADAAALAAWSARLRAVLQLVEDGDVDEACHRLNAMLRAAHAVPTLDRHDGEPWHLHFHAPEAATVDGWAAGIATGFAVAVGNSSIDRLGVCRAPSCDRVYADTSRNGTKRYCSTACQNRVKAAAFRARRAAPAVPRGESVV